MRHILITFCCILYFYGVIFAQAKQAPSFEEVLSLQSYGSPTISPDGQHTVFSVRSTDWKSNRYDTELFLSKNGGKAFQLTHTSKGSSTSPQWSPDGQWISFLANRGNKTQVYAIRAEGGEAIPLTAAKQGIQSYQWSPDGQFIAFRMGSDQKKATEREEKRYGKFEIDDNRYALSSLWMVKVDPKALIDFQMPCYEKDCPEAFQAEALIDSVDFTVTNFRWSPDGKYIAFNFQPDPLINSFFDADIGILQMETKQYKTLIGNKSYDGFIAWAPDSKSILYSTNLDDRTSNYYTNDHFYIANLEGENQKRIAEDFDESIYNWNWTTNGIYARANAKTERVLLKIDPSSGTATKIDFPLNQINGFSITKDGKTMALSGNKNDELGEIYQLSTAQMQLNKLTDANAQITNWKLANSEVVQWKSKDGTTIEGVVHKPQDFDPNKKYPLLVMIHGGPTGTDRPSPVPGYVYPVLQWLDKGAIVLRPNYRGSAGYGEKFRSLNVRNLGVGDAWDVLSGVDYLVDQGYIDSTKMGSMGWSQGGYISAFLTTSSNRFKAISVGAGISDWVTYYVNTDIHPFTQQYLQATPWEDEGIYQKTSPMTYINNASTPTLIQHGEFDRRVPIPNAYKLLQGLRDRDIDSKLVIYKGFGHGISKPKERLAAVWHNWQWFAKYIWDEEIELPK